MKNKVSRRNRTVWALQCWVGVAVVLFGFALAATAGDKPEESSEGRIREIKELPTIPPPPTPDMATLVFVRESHIAGMGGNLYIFADDDLVTVLPNRTFAWAYVREGRHRFWACWGMAGAEDRYVFEADVVGGETYCFQPIQGMAPVPREVVEEIVKKGVDLYVPTERAREKAASLDAKRKSKLDKKLDASKSSKHFKVPVTPAPEVPADTSSFVRVPKRTRLLLENSDTVTVKEFGVGSTIPFVVAEDLVMEGTAVFRKGAPVEGVVTMATKGGGGGVGGEMQITVPHVVDGAGRRIPVWSLLMFCGHSHVGAANLIFNPWIVRGKNVEIPPHSRVAVFFADDSWVRPTQ